MTGLFFQKIKRVINISDVFWKKIIESGGFIKAVNFITNHWNQGLKSHMAIYSTNNGGKPAVGERYLLES